MPIDVEGVLLAAAARPGSSVGRPQVARALVRAGHVPSVQDAFDRWLATGRPAFVPRTGPAPADVIETIHGAGGVASFAHPGVTRRDELIGPLVEQGLDAIEVYHSDHTAEDVVAYRGLAVRLGALVSGGSDFHGEDPSRNSAYGSRRQGGTKRADRSDPRSAPSRCRRKTWRRSSDRRRLAPPPPRLRRGRLPAARQAHDDAARDPRAGQGLPGAQAAAHSRAGRVAGHDRLAGAASTRPRPRPSSISSPAQRCRTRATSSCSDRTPGPSPTAMPG